MSAGQLGAAGRPGASSVSGYPSAPAPAAGQGAAAANPYASLAGYGASGGQTAGQPAGYGAGYPPASSYGTAAAAGGGGYGKTSLSADNQGKLFRLLILLAHCRCIWNSIKCWFFF